MGRQAQQVFGQRQPCLAPHGAVEPWIRRHGLRPTAFVETTEDQESGIMGTGLPRAPDDHLAGLGLRVAHRLGRQQALQQLPKGHGIHGAPLRGLLRQRRHHLPGCPASLLLPQGTVGMVCPMGCIGFTTGHQP